MGRRIVGVAVGCALWLAWPGGAAAQDLSPHRLRMIAVGGGHLQLLDWGGTGDAIVLVHGSGGSPHTFDEIGPLLVQMSGRRVIAVTRRGHGRSDAPPGPFGIDDLVDDLRAALDSAGVARAWLVGYSYGGNEITRFAERLPERTRGLVYLDATTDYTDSTVLAAYGRMPAGEPPSQEEQRSYVGYVRWLRRAQLPDVPWGPTLEATSRDELDIAGDGSLRPRAAEVMSSMGTIAMTYRRAYDALRMPVLFIYGEHRVAPSTFASDTARTQALREWEARDFGPRQQATRARIARELPAARVVTIPGTAHTSLLFVGRDVIVREILRLVGGAPPRAP